VFVFVIVTLVASVLLVAPAAGTADPAIECDDQYVKVHHHQITVLPTGVDDTENLQCALDLGASMRWAKVQLIAGDYFTSFLDVEGFHGRFSGAGRLQTTVLTLPDGLDCVARFQEIETYPHLLTFIASKVTLSDLTFAVGGEAPCAEPWEGFVDDEGFGFEEWSIGTVYATTNLSFFSPCAGVVDHRLRVHRAGFESEFPDFDTPIVLFKNFGAAISVDMTEPTDDCPATALRGDVTVRSSYFTGNGQSINLFAIEDSRVTVGGRHAWQANTFDDVGIAVIMADARESSALVMGNRLNDIHWWGVLGIAEFYDSESSMMVAKNTIRAIEGADGVGVLDFGPDTYGYSLLNATIWKNTIELVETPFNGVFVLGSDDGKVIGNRITGTGETGIWLEGLYSFDEETEEAEIIHYSSGWYVANNRLKGLDPYFVDIYLDASTTENTVKCKCLMHEVLDEGIDNTIIGCAPFEEPLAATQSAGTTARPEKDFGHPYAWVQAGY
jgi:hypothetical protein